MAIADLMKVVAPPEQPDESGSMEDLAKIEQRMGLELPTDYRQYAIRYGSGMFLGTYLQIGNPFTVDLAAISSDPNDQAQANYDTGYVPWPPFPAVPGMLFFGSNENGHSLFFLVDGDRDQWPIVVVFHGAGPNEFERWERPLGTFLAQALLNEIQTCAFHANNQPVKPEERTFTQFSELWDYRNGRWCPKKKLRQSRRDHR